MSARNDGGPAFPRPAGDTGPCSDPQYNHAQRGMTLRDWFATHAPPPPAWWLDQYGATTSLSEHGKLIADWNWAYADAMLAVREVKA